MIYNIARRAFGRGLINNLKHSYGELIYTQDLNAKVEFDKVPTYRVIDLDGKLLIKDFKYDTNLLTKVLKTMIYVDEMDSLLLKVKSQGTSLLKQEKYPSI